MQKLVISALLLLSASAVAAMETPHYPDNVTTPGLANAKVKQANIQSTICRPRWVKAQQPSARTLNAQKATQLKTGKYGALAPANYQEDHRIPIEVGGHPRDPKNLWPQAITVAWNADAKNKLETYVQTEVCAGRMKLEDGQAIFQRDWTEVFRLYCGPEPGDTCNTPGAPGQQISDPKRP